MGLCSKLWALKNLGTAHRVYCKQWTDGVQSTVTHDRPALCTARWACGSASRGTVCVSRESFCIASRLQSYILTVASRAEETILDENYYRPLQGPSIQSWQSAEKWLARPRLRAFLLGRYRSECPQCPAVLSSNLASLPERVAESGSPMF